MTKLCQTSLTFRSHLLYQCGVHGLHVHKHSMNSLGSLLFVIQFRQGKTLDDEWRHVAQEHSDSFANSVHKMTKTCPRPCIYNVPSKCPTFVQMINRQANVQPDVLLHNWTVLCTWKLLHRKTARRTWQAISRMATGGNSSMAPFPCSFFLLKCTCSAVIRQVPPLLCRERL